MAGRTRGIPEKAPEQQSPLIPGSSLTGGSRHERRTEAKRRKRLGLDSNADGNTELGSYTRKLKGLNGEGDSEENNHR